MKMNTKYSILVLIILGAAFSRLINTIPAISIPNFTPLGALALFGAAYFDKRIWAFAVPAISIFLSSLVINNTVYATDTFVWIDANFISQIIGFGLISLMGMLTLKQVKMRSVLLSSLSASLIFFLVSNFGDWTTGRTYPETMEGLLACYMAGIPYFWNTLAGDLVYCGILFGGYELAKSQIPALARA